MILLRYLKFKTQLLDLKDQILKIFTPETISSLTSCILRNNNFLIVQWKWLHYLYSAGVWTRLTTQTSRLWWKPGQLYKILLENNFAAEVLHLEKTEEEIIKVILGELFPKVKNGLVFTTKLTKFGELDSNSWDEKATSTSCKFPVKSFGQKKSHYITQMGENFMVKKNSNDWSTVIVSSFLRMQIISVPYMTSLS